MTPLERAKVFLAPILDESSCGDDEDDQKLVDACAAMITEATEEVLTWPDDQDRTDAWTEAIDRAFPTRSGSHDAYQTALAMVGHRQSKGALVALVNWLLVRIEKLGKRSDARGKGEQAVLERLEDTLHALRDLRDALKPYLAGAGVAQDAGWEAVKRASFLLVGTDAAPNVPGALPMNLGEEE